MPPGVATAAPRPARGRLRRRVITMTALLAGPGGWWLTPEAAAIHPAERTAVIADVHLGYEWARGSGGDCVPAHSLRETLGKLTTLLERARIERLIVAGDLVESPARNLRTETDLRRLADWLGARGVELI